MILLHLKNKDIKQITIRIAFNQSEFLIKFILKQ